MTETHYPDISSWNAGISLAGWPAAMAKVTEGTGYTNPAYGAQKAEAHRAGAEFAAYHFLTAGNGAGQADYCHSKAGSVPLMLDFEETPSSQPRVPDAVAFIDRYRARGGILHLDYLPEWYWRKIGSPSLQPLTDRRMALVSSVYPAGGYTATGPGWNPYGGRTPAIWQYTSSGTVNGTSGVDLNCFRGTPGELWSLWTTGTAGTTAPPAPATWQETMMNALPVLKQGATGADVRTVQGLLIGRGYAATVDGVFGPATDAVVRRFQGDRHLGTDGIVGVATWPALMNVA